MKVIVDMMGSDHGTEATVPGVLRFIEEYPDVQVFCVGNEDELKPLEGKATIIHAEDVVPMDAGALQVLRLRNSSMNVAIATLLEEEANAIVSAGSTGGFLSATTVKLKLIPGIERAAITAPFPTAIKGKKMVVLDIGASNENTPEQLIQFAKMGSIYAEKVLDIENPNVYLLSNGAEDDKGTPEVVEANKRLREMDFPGFKGNIEGREALDGHVDVLVSGGFAGNIFLKTSEGIAKFFGNSLKKMFTKNLSTKIGYLHVRKGLKEIQDTFDYKSTGGAMLLGINTVAVKAHGNSDAYTFYSALKVAYKMAKQDVVAKIKEGFGKDGS